MKIFITLLGLCWLAGPASAQGFDDDLSGGNESQTSNFQLSFSIADGAYTSVSCDAYTCDSVFYTPLDFELLLGIKLSRYFSLDLGVNWAADYYGWRYYNAGAQNEIHWLVGVRPGIRLLFPLIFHRQVYFRAAVPFQYGLKEGANDRLFVGLLLGVGIEWIFDSVGVFLEGDILPYFVEVYPGYYAIPTQGRIGFSLHF